MAGTQVLTQVGEEYIISKINEEIQTKPEWIGWGTGAGTPAKGDTNISTPATEARVQATLTKPLADKLQMVATLTADGSKTITNAGVFTTAGTGSPPSGGTLILEGSFDTGVALQAGDQIIITFTYEQT